ncbi:MAG: beta-galactosidase, partial [Kiritimatiellia bacterium]
MRRRPVLPCLATLLLLGLTARAATEAAQKHRPPEIINLAGPWRFALDPADAGVAAGGPTNALPDTIILPTTTDLAGFGGPEPDPDPGFLSRVHKYVGAAWYQREVIIPDPWSGLETELLLERVLWQSRVWIDGREVGAQDSLGTPHIHAL